MTRAPAHPRVFASPDLHAPDTQAPGGSASRGCASTGWKHPDNAEHLRALTVDHLDASKRTWIPLLGVPDEGQITEMLDRVTGWSSCSAVDDGGEDWSEGFDVAW